VEPAAAEVARLSRAADGVRAGGGGAREVQVIFKLVGDGRPYPDHRLGQRDWAKIPPRQVRLDQLVTTKRVLALDLLLDEDSTFYGDLFPHVVEWEGVLYLEDGLHRAVRAALQQRTAIHARVYALTVGYPGAAPSGETPLPRPAR
jgi:Arc/MetJ family transcription regulator